LVLSMFALSWQTQGIEQSLQQCLTDWIIYHYLRTKQRQFTKKNFVCSTGMAVLVKSRVMWVFTIWVMCCVHSEQQIKVHPQMDFYRFNSTICWPYASGK
jgi:hypothetical protein